MKHNLYLATRDKYNAIFNIVKCCLLILNKKDPALSDLFFVSRIDIISSSIIEKSFNEKDFNI